MFTVTFHKDIEPPKETVSIPLKVLDLDIRDAITRYATHYHLVNAGYVEVASNEWYLFIYVKDVKDKSHRIDVEL